eukprot:c24513_g1_i1 orf=620-2746(-)
MPQLQEKKGRKSSLSFSKENTQKRKRHLNAGKGYHRKPHTKDHKKRSYLQGKHGGKLHIDGTSTTDKLGQHTEAVAGVANVAVHPIRRKVDADTLQYFGEISSLLSTGSQFDNEEQAILIENALEETQGKECELACEKSCSRVLEMLISSSNATQIASFLHRLSPSFVLVSNDAAGSHVVEVLLKAAATVLHDHNVEATWFKTLNQALILVCQVLGERIMDTMSNCYGSHVVRSLLSVLSGVTFEASRKGTRGGGLSGRLSLSSNQADIPKQGHIIFPHLLESLIGKILEAVKGNTIQLCTDPFASPVLQAMLKILAGDASTVTKALGTLLGYNKEESDKEAKGSEQVDLKNLRQLMFDNSGSHLVEMMLVVAPDDIYLEMFNHILTPHLLEYALHQSANFVVQALIVSMRNHDQVTLLLAELKPNFGTLIKGTRSGIITSILKACKDFQCNEQEVCRSLAKAINLEAPSSSYLVPRLLFLESYARSNGSKDWKPVFGGKMSVLGCTMLQLIFSYPEECSQQFWLGLVNMEPAEILATIKDSGGCHVVESFLTSGVPSKHKNRLIAKLKGHFAELASQMISSFTLEKCFSAGKIDLKEAIASEIAGIQTDLAKTRHGPHLIRKFDLMGYSKMPDQWRTRMIAKQGTLQAFADVFDSGRSFDTTGHLDKRKTSKDSTQNLHKDKRKAVVLESSSKLKNQGKKKKKHEPL